MSNEKAATPTVDTNTVKSNEIARAVISAGIKPDDFRVAFDNGTAAVRGTVRTEEEKQKLLAQVRSANGVTSVTDSIKVDANAGSGGASTSLSDARTYTVKSGDTLSEIAEKHYGDASKSKVIFDANRNILKDPDEIKPGQVLAIPR